jgi:cbb3-type cytochrome oxidase subunit 3
MVDFLADSTGLFDNLKRTFHPLLVVLSTTLTSGRLHRGVWAAGLIVVFLVLLLCICSSFWPQRKRSQRSNTATVPFMVDTHLRKPSIFGKHLRRPPYSFIFYYGLNSSSAHEIMIMVDQIQTHLSIIYI